MSKGQVCASTAVKGDATAKNIHACQHILDDTAGQHTACKLPKGSDHRSAHNTQSQQSLQPLRQHRVTLRQHRLSLQHDYIQRQHTRDHGRNVMADFMGA
jgi:hypothetical protein